MKFTGEKLRLLRQARGMKQGELARKMGIKQQRISALENSPEISNEQVKKIFAALKLSKQEAEAILGVLHISRPAINEKKRA